MKVATERCTPTCPFSSASAFDLRAKSLSLCLLGAFVAISVVGTKREPKCLENNLLFTSVVNFE